MGSYSNQLKQRLKKPAPEPMAEMEEYKPNPPVDETPQDPYPRARTGESPIPGTIDRRDQPGVAGGMANAVANMLTSKRRFLK